MDENWVQIKFQEKHRSEKWELRVNDIVLATINHKYTGRFSVYIAVPKIYLKLHFENYRTHEFTTLDEATEQCVELLKNEALPWCNAVASYVDSQGE